MKDFIKDAAFDLGFSAVGVTTSAAVDDLEHLRDCLKSGRHASMSWLARDPQKRCDPTSLLPEARSVVCCAMAYGEEGFGDGVVSPEIAKERAASARARYARGVDYHKYMIDGLGALWSRIRGRTPEAQAKLCVDTNPIMEKALAQRAGIGWIGKHAVLLNRHLGSWFMLGEIVTDLEMEPDLPQKNRCGDCRACVDSCPTGAIAAPHVLDARRCISFYTTMREGVDPPDDIRIFIKEGTFGCDICQEVCPYNAHLGA